MYKHYISLGYFCSVALELERIGLRNCSSPFDWCISDWKGVETAINTHFKDFLKYESLYQCKEDHSHYKNMDYGIAFFHDFDKYKSLEEQLASVQSKYQRRIERFYQNISEPTLFVRYISTVGGRAELDYIEENYSRIKNMLKSFNSENDIIFIANNSVSSDILHIYSVKKDENDSVCRRPLDDGNNDLYKFLTSCECPDKAENIQKYHLKQKKKKSIIQKIVKKSKKIYNTLFFKEYIHDKQY